MKQSLPLGRRREEGKGGSRINGSRENSRLTLEGNRPEATRHPVAAGCLRSLYVELRPAICLVEHGQHPDRHPSMCHLADCEETTQAASSSCQVGGRRSASMARRRARLTWLNT